MHQDIIIAGVGGQGILTIARVISMAAIARGLNVKQAEVHGMSQRGGAVYSHLRISEQEIFSDLIPAGSADMILAIEPLEALRYVAMLREDGTVVASTNAELNIGDYPAIEQVLDHVSQFRNHVAMDMEKLARAAGGVLSTNIVALGAASLYLLLTPGELESAIEALFARKGERVVQNNIRAFRFGRAAASAYLEAIGRGAAPNAIRQWLTSLTAENLESQELDLAGLEMTADVSRLSEAESHAFEGLLRSAYEEGRRQLFEHEVYRLIELVGAINPPKHRFLPKGSVVAEELLSTYPGERVVLKLVSEQVVHKTEAGAVVIVPKLVEAVQAEIRRLETNHPELAGVLLVEFVEHEARGLGSELFVGIRATREFGPVIAAGLGGVQTEYLASRMRPGAAVAKAVAMDTSAEEFLEQFKETAAYDILAGRLRGQSRMVSDGELLRCFRAFISIARRFCVDRGEEGPDIGELEVNPFAFVGQRLVPLDGRGRLRAAARDRLACPPDKIKSLLEPASIALVGVSTKADSFGRIILKNIVAAGFDPADMFVIKPGESEIDEVQCVESIQDLPRTVDLLVVAAPAASVPGLLDEANQSGKIRSAILISGGAGETESSRDVGEAIREAIGRGKSVEGGGVALVGPNCMGIQSAFGRYDTFFVPDERLFPAGRPASAVRHPLALISQSGAFVVSRLSSQEWLRPQFTASIGNQADVTVSDLLTALEQRDEIQVIGIYLEGFADLDGLQAVRSIARCTAAGKTVIFYKGGRTESGRSAAAGHTAAVAGDYDICLTALRQAGAVVAETFRGFNHLIETATLLAGKLVDGPRIFAVTNAGSEAVAMADAYRFDALPELLEAKVATCLEKHRLSSLVSPRNPLDVTPAAGEAAYGEIVEIALQSVDVDAVVVSCVPLAPTLKTLSHEMSDPGSFVQLAKAWRIHRKPIVFVADAGSAYHDLVEQVRAQGIPVFRSADDAIAALTTWMTGRLAHAGKTASPSELVTANQ